MPCSKKHKEIKCTPPTEESSLSAFPPNRPGDIRKKALSMAAPRRFENDVDESMNLSNAQLALLDLDETIQHKMSDSRLVHTLSVINNASDPRAALDAAMQNAEFLTFCDNILGCVSFSNN